MLSSGALAIHSGHFLFPFSTSPLAGFGTREADWLRVGTLLGPEETGVLRFSSGLGRLLVARMRSSGAVAARILRTAQWTRASTTSVVILCSQVSKSTRWMPWYQEPKKDVGACDKPRGAGSQAVIRGFPNGETRRPSWAVAPA